MFKKLLVTPLYDSVMSIASSDEEEKIVMSLPHCSKSDFEDPVSDISIVERFSDLLIQSLAQRQLDCVIDLMKRYNNITKCTKFQITYIREDLTVHNFNIPSYQAMTRAIDCLKKYDYDTFLSNRSFCEQAIKSLFNTNIKHKYNEEIYPLVSVLMAWAMSGNDPSM